MDAIARVMRAEEVRATTRATREAIRAASQVVAKLSPWSTMRQAESESFTQIVDRLQAAIDSSTLPAEAKGPVVADCLWQQCNSVTKDILRSLPPGASLADMIRHVVREEHLTPIQAAVHTLTSAMACFKCVEAGHIARSGEGYRLIHDLREVNKTIQPMGPVQTLLPSNSAIPKGQPCVVLDIKDCFFSIPLHAEDKEQFAFSVVFPNGERPNLHFQWKVLPQGLVDSPTICQITVDRALMPVRHSHPAATIIQYMDDILIAAPSASQVDHLVSTITETLQANGFEITNTKIKRGLCVTFLGVGITNSYVTPPRVKFRRDIKTLHDMQRLVVSLQWLSNVILVPPEVMNPLYDLLKGKHPWDPKELTPQAIDSLDFIECQMSTGTLARWNPSILLDLYVHFTQKGGVGALAQGPSKKSQPIQWVVLRKPTHAFSPGIECFANLIIKGRKLTLRHLGTKPARIHLPFCKRLTMESTVITEHLAVALTGFGGEISYTTRPPWTQLLTIVDIDVPPKVIDRAQPGLTVFIDASSTTSTAAAVWQAGETWHCVKTCDPILSVQQLEAAAVVLAYGLFQDEPLNIVTDSIFVAKLCLAMSRPGVSTSTAASMLEEALSS
ncbi:Pol polyprotein [Lonchura striata]|uniref:ribonuclease H n=1 Tax=Lonchura striata TaxID=40157 RepID=A0A218V316_9PASE|nr:Pol polyprotein [Lonchura striata domestica]